MQKIEKIPALINGRCLQKKGDTDFFQFHLKKERLYQQSSTAIAYIPLSMHSSTSLTLAGMNYSCQRHTQPRPTPRLHQLPRQNGMHTLQVLAVTSKASTSIQYAGDENSVYRLKLSLGKPSFTQRRA